MIRLSTIMYKQYNAIISWSCELQPIRTQPKMLLQLGDIALKLFYYIVIQNDGKNKESITFYIKQSIAMIQGLHKSLSSYSY